MSRLIAFAGLPGTGKSTLSRALARALGATWIRIDHIEQALREAGIGDVGPAGYLAGYAVARANLSLGLSVVADSVNPLRITRDAWRNAAQAAGAGLIEVEIVCSDPIEHRRRVETRSIDIPGLVPPDWDAVLGREYESWHRPRLVIDTAGRSLDACLSELRAALG
ncbi:AAA family ATPase [Falsiroseomonas selenitidurans]|uniref:AAA family ATPase n=1 Tax=Falsiroseomonas selenitidurans TaxID=2716335 RepID=A0ABX1ECS3_9PROT|nr:AAA family ATPase [Falsiroseomonas selenitidurans]NKC33563.1 AAA family ATPase [Falsiroseomonas selenitidurans]